MIHGRRSRTLRILCLRKTPLQFRWEKALLDAVDQMDVTAEIEHINDQCRPQSDTDVFVVLYAAAYHTTTIEDVMKIAAKCRDANPAVRICIVACDYSERTVQVDEIAAAAKRAGLDDPFEIEIFHDVNRLRSWFVEHIEFALSVLRHRSYSVALPVILDDDPQRGGLDGEGGSWPGPIF
ncbi:hypothetical protein [Microbispora sp. H11081]|uniref:hypothetical protein n=1 Tax=Microbispora sp. H11081 TaxID=2729107 RepID=UPI00147343F3|nr:hypothetical protein [Microbispora sp. H11081]